MKKKNIIIISIIIVILIFIVSKKIKSNNNDSNLNDISYIASNYINEKNDVGKEETIIIHIDGAVKNPRDS